MTVLMKCQALQQNDGYILSAKHKQLHFSLFLRGISHFHSEVFLTFTWRYFSLQIGFQESTFAHSVKLQTYRKGAKKGFFLCRNAANRHSIFQIRRWGTWRKIIRSLFSETGIITSCGKGNVAVHSRPKEKLWNFNK